MINYFTIEFLKIRTYKTVWILLGIFILGFALGGSALESMLNKTITDNTSGSLIPLPGFSLYLFPSVWQNLFFIAGFVKLFPGFLFVMLVTNEFTHDTIRQNVITGMSKNQILNSKVVMATSIALITTLVVFLIALTNGLIHKTPEIPFGTLFQKLEFVPAYFLEIMTYLMVCLFFALTLRKPIVAILSMLVYSIIAEPIIAYKLGASMNQFLPLKAAANLIRIPRTTLMEFFGYEFQEYVAGKDILICLAYCLLFYFVLRLIMKRRDL
ncbi:MAG: ABC transporter permease [Bacteroidales bacterium]|nr:ABC transporter permease [Bacteroidales bacterium]